jgi:hypothetical protein
MLENIYGRTYSTMKDGETNTFELSLSSLEVLDSTINELASALEIKR